MQMKSLIWIAKVLILISLVSCSEFKRILRQKILGHFIPSVVEVLACAKDALLKTGEFMCRRSDGPGYCEPGWHESSNQANYHFLRFCCKDGWYLCFNLPCGMPYASCRMKCNDGSEASVRGLCEYPCKKGFEKCFGSICAKPGYCVQAVMNVVGESMMWSAGAVITFFGSMLKFKTLLADQLIGFLVDRTLAATAGQACTYLVDKVNKEDPKFDWTSFIPKMEISIADIDPGFVPLMKKLTQMSCDKQ